jgi:hypothetical protein
MRVNKEAFAASPAASRVYDLLIRTAMSRLADRHSASSRPATSQTVEPLLRRQPPE